MKVKQFPFPRSAFVPAAILALCSPIGVAGQSSLDCVLCHSSVHAQWAGSAHANTQADVATELAQSHAGEAPGSVIQGEDCIACHAPTAVQANGGMTESQALGYFFTTTNGQFSASTQTQNTKVWPHVTCVTCHDVPDNHPDSSPTLAFLNSQTGQYVPVDSASQLCGQCHGNLHFPDTDHQIYNGWAGSKHGNTQTDVAGELSQSHAGEKPDSVVQGENCIACHAPTAVLANGGMSEGQALGYFFTSSGGQFTANTVSTNSSVWPGVSCNACHDPHDPAKYSFFNSTTKQYQTMTSSADLCGQCHGNLRFPDTDHLSYNIVAGTGGIGVTNQVQMSRVSCTDCHMFASDADGSNSKSLHGHTWAVTVPEANGQSTTSCTHCHTTMDTAAAHVTISGFQTDFQTLDATVQGDVAHAAAALQGVQNPVFLSALQEAQHNLAYAESDESQGFHNHTYLMALLTDATTKVQSLPILNVTEQGANVVIWWTSSGTLQVAPSLTGTWTDVLGSTNRVTIPAAGQGQARFYRLRP
jgi:hypothetical protein